MKQTRLLLLLAVVLAVVSPVAYGAGEGAIAGEVRVDRTKVLTTGPKSDKHVVVYLEPLKLGTYPPPSERLEMDQRGMVFLPHVMSVQVGRTVAFLNSDNDRHNVYFLFEKTGKTLDIGTWGPGQTVTHQFTEPGEVITLCQLHLEMAAYILVFDHPYHTVVEIDPNTQKTSYRLAGVPPGEYRLKAWHKKLLLQGEPAIVKVEAGGELTVPLVITKKKYAKAK